MIPWQGASVELPPFIVTLFSDYSQFTGTTVFFAVWSFRACIRAFTLIHIIRAPGNTIIFCTSIHLLIKTTELRISGLVHSQCPLTSELKVRNITNLWPNYKQFPIHGPAFFLSILRLLKASISRSNFHFTPWLSPFSQLIFVPGKNVSLL